MSDAEKPKEAPPKKPPIKMRINPDGSVSFEDLPPELMDIALALNPDAVLACDAEGPEEPAEADSPGGEEG